MHFGSATQLSRCAEAFVVNILYISQYFPPEVCAPAVRVRDFSREWVRAGHAVRVLTSSFLVLTCGACGAERGDARGQDWKRRNENAKYYNEQRRVAMKNWENKPIDIRTNAIAYTMRRRDTLRMVMMKVLQQNQIDVVGLEALEASLDGGERAPGDAEAGDPAQHGR